MRRTRFNIKCEQKEKKRNEREKQNCERSRHGVHKRARVRCRVCAQKWKKKKKTQQRNHDANETENNVKSMRKWCTTEADTHTHDSYSKSKRYSLNKTAKTKILCAVFTLIFVRRWRQWRSDDDDGNDRRRCLMAFDEISIYDCTEWRTCKFKIADEQ